MKRTIIYFAAVLVVLFSGCKDSFLEQTPQGVLDESQVTSPDEIDKLVIAAYSMLGNDHYDVPFSLWPYGSVRSDDAYKGGRDEADIDDFHFYEISENMRLDAGPADGLWFNLYVGISRANAALKVLNSVSEEQYKQKAERTGELRFIRGHFYFLLKVLFKNVPYIDETVPAEDYETISNTALSNDESWSRIADDFRFAYENTPKQQDEVGRVTSYAAASYLARVLLYQAYQQDAQHNVTGVDQAMLNEVLQLTEYVMGSPYTLEPDFANNFIQGSYENGPEAIFSIQFSHDDGTFHGRLNFSDVLATPQGLGCCDFHKPSHNLVNAFKTQNGLPAFDSYNDEPYDEGIHTVDPRLYHTVAIPGYPFKYNDNQIYEESWNRNPGIYGVYASLKENVDPESDAFINIDPFYGNSKNRIIIRYADVLLMRAEALIELNREDEALPLINEIRARAQVSTPKIEYAPNLQTALYEDGVNCDWTNDFARKALRWERRLEFAMEGYRFFDLVRWGVADSVLNEYYESEAQRITYYENGDFDKNKDEYLPIPLQQINFSKGLYDQNPSY